MKKLEKVHIDLWRQYKPFFQLENIHTAILIYKYTKKI